MKRRKSIYKLKRERFLRRLQSKVKLGKILLKAIKRQI